MSVFPLLVIGGCFAAGITLRLTAAWIGTAHLDHFAETGRADWRGYVADAVEWLAWISLLAGWAGLVAVLWRIFR